MGKPCKHGFERGWCEHCVEERRASQRKEREERRAAIEPEETP